LFGGNASTAATTSAPGLSFGGTSTSQLQPSGLFSNPSSQAPQQSTTANPQQTGTLGGSFFSTSSAPQQQQQQQSQQQPTLQSNGVGGLSSHFDHLLERGRKRNAGDNGLANFEELPSLQLGLGDIARKVRNLGAGGPSADQAQERAA
jgi:nuclear pore complex protein Nup93